MTKINDQVKAFFGECRVGVFATAGDAPNVIAVAFKRIDDDGNIVICDVFMQESLKNLVKNPKVAFAFYNEQTLEGYQVKGTATYTTDAEPVAAGNAMTQKAGLTTKGIVTLVPEEVLVLTPGPDVGKTL